MRRAALAVCFLLLLTSLAPVPALAADHDVAAVAKAIERQYGMKETHIPWIARAMVKPFLWGKGVSMGFAVFEDQALPQSASVDDISNIMRSALGPEWHPFVTTVSRRDHESAVIFARMVQRQMELFIVSAESDETSVVKMKLDASSVEKWIHDPQDRGEDKSSGKTQAAVKEENSTVSIDQP